jgi:peptidoglycan/xylan/chitin deacetylase (PgdA/CDA1 family)
VTEGSRLVLKVDVDTYVGTLEGVPRLLDLLAKEGVVATFLFSLGPDSTGRALKRVFRKGFVKKVLRANPAASYGLKTMLYGTLLPSPDIGARAGSVARMREAAAAGHECGIHAWDHVDWHDRLTRMPEAEVEETVAKEHARFAEVFGVPAKVAAAPGWTATAGSVAAHERRGIEVLSDTRGGAPFHPLRPDGSPSSVLELPSTLPTLDELLAWDEFAGSESARERTVAYLARAVIGSPGLHVHSTHTEIEGGRAMHGLFARQLAAWKGEGVRFVTLGEAASEVKASGRPVPALPLGWATLPGRATPVAVGARA